MDNTDLYLIEPLKWAEVRRRVAVVEEYLSLTNPTGADRERFGAMLGLGAQQFRNLARAWETHRNALSLMPGGKRANREIRGKVGGVDAATREIARKTVQELSLEATLDQTYKTVCQRCEAAQVQPASRATVWLTMMEAKGTSKANGPDTILIGRAFLRLPVSTDDGIVFPEVIIAVQRASREILAMLPIAPAMTDHVAIIGDAINREIEKNPVPVEIDEKVHDALAKAMPMSVSVSPINSWGATRALANTLGRRVGLIDIAYKPVRARSSTVMQSGRDQAPNLEDTCLALSYAVSQHNTALS